MGDFSIRCDISGVPLPCNTEVLVIKMERSKERPRYRYPVAMPVPGVMNSYGYVDGVSDPDGDYLHVLPELWRAAGDIWATAMFDDEPVPSLTTEIEEARAEYKVTLKDYEPFKDHAEYAKLIKLRLGDHKGEWLRRLKHIVLFAPDFGAGNPICELVEGYITGAEEPKPDKIAELRMFIAAFMSSCITGTDLLGGDSDYPMEQYPTLRPDLLWHQAIVKEIKRLRKTVLS